MSSAIPYDELIFLQAQQQVRNQVRAELESSQFKLFDYMMEAYGAARRAFTAGRRVLMDACNLSKSTVERSTDELRARGLVVVDMARRPYEYSIPLLEAAIAALTAAPAASVSASETDGFKMTPQVSDPAPPPTTARALVSDVDSDVDSDKAREARNPEPAPAPVPVAEVEAERTTIEDHVRQIEVEEPRPPGLVDKWRRMARAYGHNAYELCAALADIAKRVAHQDGPIRRWAYWDKCLWKELKERAKASHEARREARAARAAAKVPAANIVQTAFDYEYEDKQQRMVEAAVANMSREEKLRWLRSARPEDFEERRQLYGLRPEDIPAPAA